MRAQVIRPVANVAVAPSEGGTVGRIKECIFFFYHPEKVNLITSLPRLFNQSHFPLLNYEFNMGSNSLLLSCLSHEA